jgi:hypothetical protein
VGSGAREFDSTILTANANGKGVRKLASGLPITISLVAAGGYVYWPDEDGIGRVAVDGSHLNRDYIPLPPEDGGGVADGLAIEGNYLFFSRCQDATVGRVDLDGTDIEQDLVSMSWPNCPQALAASQGRVYWAELGDFGERPGRIGSARLDGGGVHETTILTGSPDGPFSLAAGNGTIFWSWGGAAGSPSYIARSRLDGSNDHPRYISGDGAIALMPGSH